MAPYLLTAEVILDRLIIFYISWLLWNARSWTIDLKCALYKRQSFYHWDTPQLMKSFLSVSSLSHKYLEKETIEATTMLSSITRKHPKISKAAELFFQLQRQRSISPQECMGMDVSNHCLAIFQEVTQITRSLLYICIDFNASLACMNLWIKVVNETVQGILYKVFYAYRWYSTWDHVLVVKS